MIRCFEFDGLLDAYLLCDKGSNVCADSHEFLDFIITIINFVMNIIGRFHPLFELWVRRIIIIMKVGPKMYHY